METEETRKLIDTYYRALTSGDRDTVASLVADDCVWLPPSTADFGPIEGGDAVVAELTGDVVKRTFDISKPFNLDVRSVIVDGDKAVVQQRLTATAKATGAEYDNQYCWVYTCRDGRIVHMEEYADTLLASRVMGWDQAEA
ncbi:MAG: nuclear transport factor 2 family protein [Acidimicrobiia bacterium]|nr:nuclear transport factor 2 family protein [Acidimicrobiia bacterium]